MTLGTKKKSSKQKKYLQTVSRLLYRESGMKWHEFVFVSSYISSPEFLKKCLQGFFLAASFKLHLEELE